MIYFNIIITLSSLWICLYIYDSFIRPALELGKRYRLNVLRDKVELMVFSDDISVDNNCYLMLSEIMDESIDVMTDFRISKFLEFLVKYNNYRLELQEMFRTSDPETEPLRLISEQFFKEMRRIIYRETKSYEKLILPMVLFFARMFKKTNTLGYNFFVNHYTILAKARQ